MARYSGRKGVIYLAPNGTGAATTIIAMSKWSLNMATDKVDVTAFSDTNKQSVQGLPDIKGTISGFWDDTSDTLYDVSKSTDGTKMYLYPSADATTKYWYGPAWIDFNIDVGVGDAVTISGDFVGNGAWGQF